MDDLRLISRGLYNVLNEEIGTEGIVDMRRRVMALKQILHTAKYRYDEEWEDIILGGSKSEGLRFVSSDYDYMIVHRGIRVVFDLIDQLPANDQTLLIAECQITKPGYTLLKLPNESLNPYINHSRVQREHGHYISSQKWRDKMVSLVSNEFAHGPCSTAFLGISERDNAHCLKSDRLPRSAHGFIHRLHKAHWPSISTLQKIISGGCYFVSIGAKESQNEFLEWRISFSTAEKLLIHSMNNVQLLCYALLKIFLKEAIDSNENCKDLLCSYFLKTTLFWEISGNNIPWNSSNFLNCFWICFQRLLYWIKNEYCPNFVIPENNMFAGKIYGTARAHLLSHMVTLYKEGYRCLLRCPTIRSKLFPIIERPQTVTSMESSENSDKCVIGTRLILEIWNAMPTFHYSCDKATSDLKDIENLMQMSNNELEQGVLQIWRGYSAQSTTILKAMENSFENSDHDPKQLEDIMPEIDLTRRLLYTALFHCRRGYYHTAIVLLKEAKLKLQNPYILYPWKTSVEKYRAAGGEHKPFTQMMKEIVAWPVKLNTVITVSELLPENRAAAEHSSDRLLMSPRVLTHFLLFLCYHHMQNVHEKMTILRDLSDIVVYDNRRHIPDVARAISWQVLGICQEMSGDHAEAYQSYNNALKQKWCEVKVATEKRIRLLTQ